MSEKLDLPDIEVLSAFSPVVTDGALYSPNLRDYIQEYSPFESAMWGAFLVTSPDELEELSKARKLAEFYYLRTAEKLQNNPQDYPMWVDRFNHAGIEMHGAVNPHEVIKIAAKELEELTSIQTDTYAAQIYRKLTGGAEKEESEPTDTEILELLRDTIFDRFSEIAEVIGELPEGPYEPAVVREAFDTIRRSLAQHDDGWSEWSVSNTEGKTMLSIIASKKQIEVPDGRGPVESKEELFGLAIHEIGVHAQRAVNGDKTDDELMSKGMPKYIHFEEGLGIFFEYLVTGTIPDKIVDRYIDIALATGAVNDIILGRAELINLGISRKFARFNARNEPLPAEQQVRQSVVSHVNRIFRGGTAQPVRDINGAIITQPVFNKDLVYYEGFIKARDFMSQQIAASVSEKHLLEYLLAGKFDPTNSTHTSYMKTRHNIHL